MAREPEDAVPYILRDIQATLAEHTRMHQEQKTDLRRIRQEIIDLNQTVLSSGGLAVKSTVKVENLQSQINALDDRLRRVEEVLPGKS